MPGLFAFQHVQPCWRMRQKNRRKGPQSKVHGVERQKKNVNYLEKNLDLIFFWILNNASFYFVVSCIGQINNFFLQCLYRQHSKQTGFFFNFLSVPGDASNLVIQADYLGDD